MVKRTVAQISPDVAIPGPSKPQSDNRELSLNCWALAPEQTHGNVFVIDIEDTEKVATLKKYIKNKKPQTFGDVEADGIELWSVSASISVNPKLPERVKEEGIVEGESLSPVARLSEIFPHTPAEKELHIVAQAKSGRIPPAPQFVEMETSDIQPHVTLEALKRGDFGGERGLQLNNITELDVPEPLFVTTFKTKLKQRRLVEPATATEALKPLIAFPNYFEENSEPSRDGTEGRWADHHELWHHAGAFEHTGLKKHTTIKEETMRWHFDQLAVYFSSILNAKDGIRTEWPLPLIMHVESENKRYRYTPRSDFHLSVNDLPFLIIEIQSETNQSDRYRMLLQAACLVRLGNGLAPERDNTFVVMALYIESSGRTEVYLVFAPDRTPKISYITITRDLNKPLQLFETLFEIYNLASAVQDDQAKLETAQHRILTLKTEIGTNLQDAFTVTKKTHKEDPTNPSRTNNGGGTQHGEGIYDNHEVAQTFAEAGYSLESNGEDENGWAPLNELQSTMRRATQPDGTAVVVKLIHARSNEPSILQYLGSITSVSNHTIPLLATFNLSVGTFIVTPESTPLDLGCKFGYFQGKISSLCQQLVDGVAFLHENHVAHLDIKPGNIVVTGQSHLYLIDFDISVLVDGPDELIDQWLGTPPWMAPEIGDQDAPRCPYSPIRADLWSCGLVLQYLASGRSKEGGTFKTLAEQLLNRNPLLRPMLATGQDHDTRKATGPSVKSKVTGAVAEAGGGRGRLKRKRDAVNIVSVMEIHN